MKKFVSLGLCGLLFCTMHLTAVDATVHTSATEARDAKTSHVLTNVVKVVEGIINIIKIIKEARHDKQDIKLQAQVELTQAVANIKSIASVSLPQEEISRESAQELCAMLREVAATIQPLLRESIQEDVASVHNYLQNTPLQELQQQLEVLHNLESDTAITSTDEHEKEFHTHIIQALHSLVENLFSIIQSPENPKIIGQNIADMLSNIINVASQTLKYEYLSSHDAEENVANYLESFSNELTKEIKHLMLQTALHLRGCSKTRACCNNSCSSGSCGSGCSTVCRPCCRPCSTCSLNIQEDTALRKSSCCSSCSCSPQCSTTCSSCSNSCCSLRAGSQEKSVTRACPSCGCGNCVGGCCSYGTRKPITPKEIIRRAIVRNNKHRACSCSSCGKNSGSCGCRKKITEIKQEIAEQTKCGCGAKPKPRPTTTTRAENTQTADHQTKCGCGAGKIKPKPQTATTRAEGSQTDEISKCGCGAGKIKPKPTTVTRHNGKLLTRLRQAGKTLIFPEGYNG